jgi:hypothetical protein
MAGVGLTQVYPEQHYYQGRWTNGWVWADFMRDYYNNTVHNYAIGGEKPWLPCIVAS